MLLMYINEMARQGIFLRQNIYLVEILVYQDWIRVSFCNEA